MNKSCTDCKHSRPTQTQGIISCGNPKAAESISNEHCWEEKRESEAENEL
jgi:hypothetical protein